MQDNLEDYLEGVRWCLALDVLDDTVKRMAVELREQGLNARSAAYTIKRRLIDIPTRPDKEG